MDRAAESLDDLEARLARQRDEAEHWVEEHSRLMPQLWFVLRHSGRAGEKWRVVFESRSREEAERAFERKAYGGRARAVRVARTVLTHGGYAWDHEVMTAGMPPNGAALGLDDITKAAHEREAREARQARRARRRIAAPPVERVRIATVVEDVDRADLAHEEAAVAEAVTAERRVAG